MNGPEHYRKAEELAKLAARYPDSTDAPTLAQLATAHATLALVAAQTAPAAPQLETEPTVAYVYKAAWGMTPLGTYTNRGAAQTHCMADATNNAEAPEGLSFEWFGDASEPGDPCELLIKVGGEEQSTEYTVTRVAVDAEYDPEADA
ncbi:hypothetical protein OG508_28240 [Streptomyces sp. NBC_01108]|uniref:hypothetical protein n=1 Tax=Streptomyces sp. NBC_01108 TaxID=2903751 RepID=UPI00387371E6|nr:hypothetical protein OG508_28240 [Streptomyces sp. NBC_01108]